MILAAGYFVCGLDIASLPLFSVRHLGESCLFFDVGGIQNKAVTIFN